MIGLWLKVSAPYDKHAYIALVEVHQAEKIMSIKLYWSACQPYLVVFSIRDVAKVKKSKHKKKLEVNE